MSWKDILSNNGFTWNEEQELYIKGLGFGRKVTVWMFMRGLFIIEEGNKTIFDGYITSEKQFTELIESL